MLQATSADTDIEKSDRALIAFIFLTGARDGAAASFKLKRVDVLIGKVEMLVARFN
jgi:hypothetical protein